MDVGVKVTAEVDTARRKLEELGAEFKALGVAARAPVTSLADLDKAIAANIELGRRGAISMKEAEDRASALGEKFKHLTDSVDKTNIKFGELGTEAMKAAADSAGLGGFRRTVESTTTALDTAGISIGMVGVGLGVTLVAAAGVAFSKLMDGIGTVRDLGDKLHEMSQITGMSVERLGGLKLAAEVSGTSVEGLAMGLTQFNRHIDSATKGTGASADAFKRLGIDIRDTSGNVKDTNQLFNEFVDKMSRMEDGSEKVAIGTALMGRQFRTLIPLVNEGSDGFAKLEAEARKAGIVMSTETAAAADKLNDNLAVLKAYGQGFWIDVASPIVEALAKVTTAMRDARFEGAGFFESMIEGARRLFAEVFFGGPKQDLSKNLAEDKRLTASIDAAEARKKEPGYKYNPTFEAMLAAEYRRRDAIRAGRGPLQDAVDVDSPNYFKGGSWSGPVDIYGQPIKPTGGSGKPGKTEDPDKILAKEFAAAERFFLGMYELGDIGVDAVEEFYRDWESIADDSADVLMTVRLNYSRFLKRSLDEDETEERTSKRNSEAEEKRFRRSQELMLRDWERIEKGYYKDSERAVNKQQNEVAAAAQKEIAAIKDTVFFTRDEKIVALQELANSWEYSGIKGQKAQELIREELRKSKTDAQVFSENLQKMFSIDVPNSVLKTVGAIQGDLSSAIFNVATGSKSLGESVKGFFEGIGKSILKMLADIAAHKVMEWIFGKGAPLDLSSLFSFGGTKPGSTTTNSVVSGATSALTGGGSLAKTIFGAGSNSAPVVDAVVTPVTGAASAAGGAGLTSTVGASLVEDGLYSVGSSAAGGSATAAGAVTAALNVAVPIAAAALAIRFAMDWNDKEAPGVTLEQTRGIADAGITSEFLRVMGRPPTQAEVDSIFNSGMVTPVAGNPGRYDVTTGDLTGPILALTGALGPLGPGERAHFLDEGGGPLVYKGIIDDDGNIRWPEYATGTDTIVSRRTLFSAGESGAERVTVSPLAGAAHGRSGGNQNITFNGPTMWDEYTFRRFKRMVAAGA